MDIEVLEEMFHKDNLIRIPDLFKLDNRDNSEHFRRSHFFMSVKEEGKESMYFDVVVKEGLREIFDNLFKDRWSNNHINVFIKGSNTRIVFEDGMYISRHIEDVPTDIFKKLVTDEGIISYNAMPKSQRRY